MDRVLVYPGAIRAAGGNRRAAAAVDGDARGRATFSGAIAVSYAGAATSQGGQVDFGSIGPGPSFVNPTFVSGSKFNASSGFINAGSIGGCANLPGSTGGTTSFGGQAP